MGKDPLGIFAWTTLWGGNDRLLYIITTYRVFQTKGTKTTRDDCNISHWQLVQGMIKKEVVDPDPHSQVLTDLTAFIKTKYRSGCEIMLMMGAHDYGRLGTQWHKFTKDNAIHGAHKILVPQSPATTRHDSNVIINFMLTSQCILCYAQPGGYGALQKGCICDHVLIWAYVDFKAFLTHSTWGQRILGWQRTHQRKKSFTNWAQYTKNVSFPDTSTLCT